MLTPEEKIKLIRKKYRLSQKEVCRGVCGESNLSQIENGRIKLKKNGNAKFLISNINKLLKKKGIAYRVDEGWVFESVQIQIKKSIDKIIIDLYKNQDIEDIEKRVKDIFLKHIDSYQGGRVFFTLGSYFYQKKERKKAKEYFVKSLDYSRESKNYHLLSVAILQLLRLNFYLRENAGSREIYSSYFNKFKIPSREIEANIIYNYAVALQCLEHYQEAVGLYKSVPEYTSSPLFLEGAENNTAICMQEIGEYEDAIKIWKDTIDNTSDTVQELRALCNIISCARVMKNHIQCKISVEKAEKLLPLVKGKGKKLYQKYYCLAMGYDYIKDRENAIRYFEKELSLGVDLNHSQFHPAKYLECILKLLKLYTKREEKKIIYVKKIIENLPVEMLSLEFVLSVLKVFDDHIFTSETTSLINNLYIKMKNGKDFKNYSI